MFGGSSCNPWKCEMDLTIKIIIILLTNLSAYVDWKTDVDSLDSTSISIISTSTKNIMFLIYVELLNK